MIKLYDAKGKFVKQYQKESYAVAAAKKIEGYLLFGEQETPEAKYDFRQVVEEIAEETEAIEEAVETVTEEEHHCCSDCTECTCGKNEVDEEEDEDEEVDEDEEDECTCPCDLDCEECEGDYYECDNCVCKDCDEICCLRDERVSAQNPSIFVRIFRALFKKRK